MNPEASSPDRLTQRAARAVHTDLRTVLEAALQPFSGAADLRRLKPLGPPEELPRLTGLLPLLDDSPGAFVEAAVVPDDATSANVQLRFLLGRLHVRRFRALSFLLANTHDTDLKVSAADGGRHSRELWVSWQRNHAVGDAAALERLALLAATRVSVVQALLRLHFPGLIAGARLAEWTAAAARSQQADRAEHEEAVEEGHIWHLAAQDPREFLEAMEAQAAAADEPLSADVRLQLHLWREDFPAALAALEELFQRPVPAEGAWELGHLRVALHQRVGQAETALALLDGLSAPAGEHHRVTALRVRCLLGLGRAREVLALIEQGGFSAMDPTCWPHWWRAQALLQLGDVDGAREALAAHEEFFGTDLEARRSLSERMKASEAAPNFGGRP